MNTNQPSATADAIVRAAVSDDHENASGDFVYRRLVQSITDYAICMLDVDGIVTT
ncbi:hypothetical protein [Candidatus Burkholderia verschuerenii]|uniref:hypothetical protein n=1 Tax=Candidatus Burkholderia verschuerenii TaxID=242163 RepID=UPI001E65B5D8|nr:hypothetical protein [Candidatus Burkholderia verschuerenii]